MKCVVVIPARLNATRFPRKPLLLIRDVPMVVSVAKNALNANIGAVFVACCGEEIQQVVASHGVLPILTDPCLSSGTDRVFAALKEVAKPDIVINLQSDIPQFDPIILKNLVNSLNQNPSWDIATPVAPLLDPNKPSRVKVALTTSNTALYFSRSPIPYGAKTFFEHVGIYAFRYSSLEKFVSLPQARLELDEKLEQLRALDAGMTIGCIHLDKAPLSIDTYEDYEYFLKCL